MKSRISEHSILKKGSWALPLSWILATVSLTLHMPVTAQTTPGGNAANGTLLYVSKGCNGGCHGPSLTFPASLANAINAGGHTTYANTQGMGGQADTTGTQYRDISAYFASLPGFADLATQSVTFQTARAIAVPNIVLNTIRGDYVGVRVVTNGGKGSASAFAALSTTYTPSAGQCGPDSFTYEAFRTTDGGTSNLRTVSINISNPAVPVIATSASTMTGTYNSLITSFTPVSTGGVPLSYALTGPLPTGLGFSTATGVISGTPIQVGTFNVTVAARNCFNGAPAGQSGSKLVTITINPAPQTITFNALSNKFTTDPPFVVAATGGGSGIAVMFAATGVCTISGTTITLTGATGICTVTATQAGNTNYTAASAVMQSFMVADAGTEVFPPNCQLPPGWLTPVAATVGWAVSNEAGAASQGVCGLKSNPVPLPSTGFNRAQIQFTGVFNAGSITFSRRVSSELNFDCFRFLIDGAQQNVGGTCAFSGGLGASGEVPYGTVTAPITAGSHTVTWSYEVEPFFPVGADAAWIDQVTMPLSTTISGVTNVFGSVGQVFNSSVTASNFPFSYSATGLPPGVNINSSTGVMSGTPTTAGNYNAMVTASNPGGANPGASDLKSVGFLIFKGGQTITFAPISTKLTSLPSFTVSATGGPSGNPVIFTASGVCSASGTNGTTISLIGTVGTCTVTADQAGNANYDLAQAVQAFSVVNAASEIFPPMCTMPPGWSVPAGATTGWSVSANEEASTGACSLKSMPMPDSGTPLQADIRFVGNLSTGNITFKYRVSSENGYDCFQFFIDSTAQNIGGACGNIGLVGASGETGWTSVSVPVNGGLHSLTWRYDKDDVCCNGGRDAVWIDDVVLPQFTLNVQKIGAGSGSVTSTPVGIDCGLGGSCSASLSGNVLLTPNPSFLSFFAGWSFGVCTGTAPCTVTMDASKSVTATFSPATAPGAPTNVTATPGDGQAALTFGPPASDGGSPITSYGANCAASGQTTRFASGGGSPLTVTSLVNGVQYSCTVGVSNFAGSTFAAPVLVTPRTTPGAPTSVAAAPGNMQATVSFVPPLITGGSVITGYTATCGIRSNTGTISPITVTGLTNGITVNCAVTATNAAGIGAASSSVAVTPRTVPSAPSNPVATVFDARAIIDFTPSVSNGGSAITGYTLSCNGGSVISTGPSTPITITGLVNGTTYTCFVAANNAAGSTPSTSFAFVPIIKTGTALWTQVCANCHTPTPTGAQLNAAGPSAAALNYSIINQPSMAANPLVTQLTTAERAAIVAYIATAVPTPVETTPFNTPKLIDVGNRLSIGSLSFDSVRAGGVLPASGTLSAFTGTAVTYTPNAGYVGSDTFTVVGSHDTAPIFLGSEVTISVNVLPPTFPTITSMSTASGANGVAFSYQITASNGPTSFGASGLPAGLSVNAMTGLISGTPIVGGMFNANVTATNAGGTGMAALTITLNAANQTITFPPQTPGTVAFSPSPSNTFAIAPLASASSLLPVTYTPNSPTVCGVSGNTVTMVSAGNCVIAANQSGNANFNVAAEVTQTVIITPSLPGAPTIGAATPGNMQATIAFVAPVNNGGSAITSYSASCTPSGAGSNMVSPVTVTGLTNDTTYTCSVRANNSAGSGPASSTVTVTPVTTPVAPTITSATATSFTVNAAGTFTVTASGTPSTFTYSLSGALPGGVTFNTMSGVLAGTPALGSVGAYPLTLGAANGVGAPASQMFTLNVAKTNQTITFTGPSSQNFSVTPIALTAMASSALTVTFIPNTPAVCTVAAANVTLVGLGTCTITAQQIGDANYNAAPTVTQSFSVSQGGQTITFGAQASPRAYATNAMFALSPVASASSNLTVAYTSLTTAVCSISSTTVTILRAGQCTIAANQAGNGSVSAAPQVTQTISITGSAPGAPTIGSAAAGDMRAMISFTAPASDGGSAVTAYTATCAGITGSGSVSPVTVSGLTNGTSYACSVTATNALGTSAASGTVNVTPNPLPGAPIWAAKCASCHGVTPVGPRLNVGGSTPAALAYSIVNQVTMNSLPSLNPANFPDADRIAVAEYVRDFIPPVAASTTVNTPVDISVTSQIVINTPIIAFANLQVVTLPANGTLSAFAGTSVTYTPSPGFTGTDTFTYRGTQAALTGDPRTVTVTIANAAPVIASATIASGTVGQAFSYQIIASNAPTGYAASGLPGTLSINTSTGLISGTPNVSESINATISATNAGGTGMSPLTITVNLIGQTISFGAQPSPRAFTAGGTFAIAPLATGGASGNLVTYSSTTTGVCGVIAPTVTMAAPGLCIIAADQAGNASYAAAARVSQNVVINASVPGAPTIGVATPGDGQATIAFVAPASNGGSAITSYTLRCVGPNTVTASGGASPLTVSGMINGANYACNVFATNSAGNGADSATVNVTPSALPPLALVSVLSRKTHGAAGDFDLSIDNAVLIGDAVTTEPRGIGAGHTLVFQFNIPVTAAGIVSVIDSATAPVGVATLSNAANNVMVTLTGIADNKRVTVILTNVNGIVTPFSTSIGFLVGDVNGTRSVNSSDISGVKARSGQPTDALNFKFDVNASGAVNSSDISAVKARSGLTLAP